MWPVLIGLETEYGLLVEGRGAEDQVDDSMALVRGTPDGRFVGWDYRFESPRADLRGFQVDRLTIDPEDARFDVGSKRGPDNEVRSDRVLANGARFYNDHGHPEYSTPECLSLRELALNDAVGERVVLRAARALQAATGKRVCVYKNNSDGHGASFGTHESYLVPRRLGYERVFRAVVPLLVARQVVCGAGKVGAEAGTHCDFQISQRADFFTETSSVDTLYRRPVFNTRDEPHADPNEWMRLHVICGDSNRISSCNERKFALIKLALWLAEEERAPAWSLASAVRSFSSVSRDLTGSGRIELEDGNWTTSRQIVESYVEAADRYLDSSDKEVCEALDRGRESVDLFEDLDRGGETLATRVDWAAKLRMLDQFVADGSADWGDPSLKSYDLAYHDLDPEESLFDALCELEMVEERLPEQDVTSRASTPGESTRAFARSVAVRQFAGQLVGVSWGCLTFDREGDRKTLVLPPDVVYPRVLEDCRTLDDFLRQIEELS